MIWLLEYQRLKENYYLSRSDWLRQFMNMQLCSTELYLIVVIGFILFRMKMFYFSLNVYQNRFHSTEPMYCSTTTTIMYEFLSLCLFENYINTFQWKIPWIFSYRSQVHIQRIGHKQNQNVFEVFPVFENRYPV